MRPFAGAGPVAVAARMLRKVMVEAERVPVADAPTVLTPEEQDILERIAKQTDARIAQDLGLTYDALR